MTIPALYTCIKAYCDMETDGGGWTVFQRREDGSVNFDLPWTNYVHGFGNVSGEYWLGLSKLHRLAYWHKSIFFLLRVDMKDKTGLKAYAKYSRFYISSSYYSYQLHVWGYSGSAGDSLGYHHLQRFSTKDKDNDQSSGNCAAFYHGAWWYNNCYQSALNGLYDGQGYKGVYWSRFKGSESLPFTEMKIRCYD